MFTGRAELLDRGETTTEHKKNQREEAEKLDQDKANSHLTEGGLFGGLFKPKPPSLQPVIDVDDGVARCPHCSWELEDGINCAGCGYRYRPGSEGTDDSLSADYSETDLDTDDLEDMDGVGPPTEDEYGEIDDNDAIWHDSGFHYHGLHAEGPGNILDHLGSLLGDHGMMPLDIDISMHPGGFGAPVSTNGSEYDEEDDDEENEYDESDSFIDADNDHVPTSSFIENDGHVFGSGEVYEGDSDRSTGTVVDDIHGDNPTTRTGRHYRNTTPYFNDDDSPAEEGLDEEEEEGSDGSDDGEEVDEDSDESDEDEIRTAPPRRVHPQYAQRSSLFQAPSNASWLTARPPTIIPDSDDLPDSSDEGSSSPPRPARSIGRIQHGSSANTAITLDGSDDDQPVGPVRRATQRRRARFSPY